MSPLSPRRLSLSSLVALALLAAFSASPAAAQNPCATPVTNKVACENTQAGATDWEVDGAGDPSIQGFATAMSVKPGDTIGFKIKSATSSFKIDVLRLGWYGGAGARKLAEDLTPTGPSTQPSCLTNSTTGLIDCGNWSTTRSWTVPSNAVSGVYIAHLKRNDGNGDSQITFVVRDESSSSDIVVQTSDATWQAYNDYGGNSLYKCEVACPPGNPLAYKAAYDVSYNRPFNTAVSSRDSWLMTGAEYPLIRFLERNGYDVSYLSGLDVHRRGSLIRNHDVFISSGHDEYWSATQRSAMEAARDAGVNLAFLTGNEGYWKTRWKPSGDGTNTADRTITSYKDTHFNGQQDPVEWTGTWADPRYTTAASGVKPQNALTGQLFVVNSGTTDITVPSQYRQLRMWRNTAVASLGTNQSLTLAPNTLGYEWDVDADNGYRPAGQFRLSSTTASGLEVFTDYGSTTEHNRTDTHNLTMYRAPSGARVFGAGTVQWAFGLDDFNTQASENTTMQQATVNLLADMRAQPKTRQSNLQAASASTDSTAPTSTVSSPTSTVQDGANVTISGTASDGGGGVVAGVEVSTDNGGTWHPATGTTSWTYSWKAHGNPSATIRSRAVDDSGNIQTSNSSRTVSVSCPCSIWGPNVTPSQPDAGDGQAIEVGVKFKSDSYGQINGIRFYKSAANTGTHTGSLWTLGGQRLAQVTFTGETASGWQTATFSQPVIVQPGTTYIASYHAPHGHYSATADYFHRAPAPLPQGGAIVDSPPLHALLSQEAGGNGVYNYDSSSTFPTNSFNAANYWVDVSFSPLPAPGQVTGVTASAGGPTSATVNWSAPSSGGPPTSYEVTPYVGSTAQTSRIVTVTGSQPLETRARVTGLNTGTTYTFRVRAINPAGAGAQSSGSNSVTPLTIVPPTAATDVQARPGSNSARLTWTAPYSNGESAITAYRITPIVSGQAQTPVEVGPSETSATVGDLTNGTSYTFTVAAKNAAGTGAASSPSNAVTPQATIFDFATPDIADAGDPDAVELGVKFRSDVPGQVTGVRFYKAAANTGTHTGSLWTAGGQRLAQVTFTGETASGWQTATFSQPVNISANTTYVVSYFAPNGHYSVTGAAFANSGVDNPPLHALSTNADNNGVYVYSATSAFPFKTYNAANYFVDAMFAVPPPGTVTGVSAVRGSESANVSWSAPSSGGPVTSYRITPYVGSTAQTPTIVSGSPLATSKQVIGLTQGTSYTFRVSALNANGAGPASAPSNAVTPFGPSVPSAPTGVLARPASHQARVSWTEPSDNGGRAIGGYTLTPYVGGQAQAPVAVGPSATSATVTGLDNGTAYTFKLKATNAIGTGSESAASAAVTPRATIFDFATPEIEDAGDPSPVEVGVKFRPSVDGEVTGVRFYKAAANTGTHTGSLWTLGGQRLAQVTFTGETASGWQTATFSEPVDVDADATYVVSYFAPNGHYSVTGGAFASGPVNNPPLSALANEGINNGVYAYGGVSSFPSNNFNAANYWVDVLFATEGPPSAPTGVAATAGPASAELSWSAPSGGGSVTSYEVTPYVGSTAQTPVTVSGSPPATAKVVSGLTAGTSYRFTIRAIGPGGQGPASALSNAVTPTATAAPSAPTNLLARPASHQARVSWTEPANDGGSAITGYTLTPYVGGDAQTPVEVGPSATATTVTGLDNGTAYTFKLKATNAIGAGPASTASAPVIPRATIFDFATPEVVDGEDGGSINLGLKFTSEVDGEITGVRFYKAAANTGTHTGTLWTLGGQQLAQVTFTDETASGWQTAIFDEPVSIDADATYVVSYFAPNGHYSVTGGAFAGGPVSNPPLRALANEGVNNGVYAYGGVSSFPSNNFNAANYWVDVLFATEGPPSAPTGVAATAGPASAELSWSAPSGGGSVTSYEVTPYVGSTAQTPVTVSGSPPATAKVVSGLTAGTSYRFTVRATGPGGAGPASALSDPVTPTSAAVPTAPTGVRAQPASSSARVSWTEPSNDGGSGLTGYAITPHVGGDAQTPVEVGPSATATTVTGLDNGTAYAFTVKAINANGPSQASTASAPVTPQATIFDFATPEVVDGGDGGSINLGLKFTSEVDGHVTGVRFYKAATNTGTHVGQIWSGGDQLLGETTFTDETASGWQVATFAEPIPIAAELTYVVSYFAPNGHYSVTPAAFANVGVDNPPLHALANGLSNNGVYGYGGSPTLPSNNFNATNYWVDVLVAPSAP